MIVGLLKILYSFSQLLKYFGDASFCSKAEKPGAFSSCSKKREERKISITVFYTFATACSNNRFSSLCVYAPNLVINCARMPTQAVFTSREMC